MIGKCWADKQLGKKWFNIRKQCNDSSKPETCIESYIVLKGLISQHQKWQKILKMILTLKWTWPTWKLKIYIYREIFELLELKLISDTVLFYRTQKCFLVREIQLFFENANMLFFTLSFFSKFFRMKRNIYDPKEPSIIAMKHIKLKEIDCSWNIYKKKFY